MNVKEPTLSLPPPIEEVRLEPVHTKGELVPDSWWVPDTVEKQAFWRRHWLFIVTVALPMFIASVYLFVIASDQYLSETQFIVRTSSASGAGNLASLMGGQKISRATDETFAVTEYLQSRDAVQSLVKNGHLREILARPGIDMFNRFPNFLTKDNNEQLYKHFLRFVDVKTESESGIATLHVRAFTPEDARDLTAALLKDGEGLVNRLNVRAYSDALRFAGQLVEEKKQELLAIEKRLTQFRNDEKVIDPNKEAAASLTILGGMMSNLMEMEASLNQQTAVAVNGPGLGPMRERVRSYREEIAKQRLKIAGDDNSMAAKLAKFDELVLDRELAAKGLEAAVVHLTGARQDADQQQLYIQTIVAPNMSDESRYPRRGLYFLLMLGLCLCVYWTAKAFVGATMEHQA